MMEPPSGAEAPSAIRVRWEIWESLISMLRVYAYAASLNHGEFAVNTRSGAAWIRHKGNVLDLGFRPGDGLASWRLSETESMETRGSFEILGNGVLLFDGQEKQLDQAAIEWVEALAKAGRRIEAKENTVEGARS